MSGRAHPISGYSPQQTHFPFIPVETVIQMTALHQEHFEKQDEREAKRLASERKRLELKVINGELLEIDWRRYRHILDLPLFAHEPSDLDVQPAEGEDDEPEDDVTPAAHQTTSAGFNEEEVEKLHCAVLDYSLKVLRSQGNAEEKYEVLRWIFAPPIFCWVTKSIDGIHQRIPIYRRQLPFMFETCCAISGLRADDLRAGFAWHLRDTLKALGMQASIDAYTD